MSERKVLNKYYPPDFDASKLPRVKREKNRQFTIRLMAPFNMRCKTCGEYIYRGKKFNARKEDCIGDLYLGIQIYRFYIKCTKCLAEITFLTDPANQDYAMENGAIRNFESVRLAEKQAETEAKQKKEDEANNPMKILENRTRDSRREMAILETLEDLRELNAANAGVDPKILIQAEDEYKRQLEILQQEEDELEIRNIFGSKTVNNDASFEEVEIEPVLCSSKQKRVGNEEEDINSGNSKKIKTEPTQAQQFATTSSNDTKKITSSISQFIKKKPLVPKSEPKEDSAAIVQSKQSIQPPTPVSLSNLLSSYGEDSGSSNDTDEE